MPDNEGKPTRFNLILNGDLTRPWKQNLKQVLQKTTQKACRVSTVANVRFREQQLFIAQAEGQTPWRRVSVINCIGHLVYVGIIIDDDTNKN